MKARESEKLVHTGYLPAINLHICKLEVREITFYTLPVSTSYELLLTLDDVDGRPLQVYDRIVPEAYHNKSAFLECINSLWTQLAFEYINLTSVVMRETAKFISYTENDMVVKATDDSSEFKAWLKGGE